MRLCSALVVAALLVARAHAAPTQDTLVVRAADSVSSSAPSPVSDVGSAPESDSPTSDAPPAPLKIKSMEVKSEVSLRYAHTTVLTRMSNPADRAQEATFSLILPETAFISGFVMTLDGKDYKAYVKEKEEAKAVYASAVAQGLGAAHISAKARDSNHFTVRVNIEPKTDAVFNLTYEELLDRRNGVYNHAINLNPGRPVPKLDVTVHVKEGKRITVLRVPEMRTGNEIDATEEDKPNPNAKIVKSADEHEATVTFSPDVAEQQRLMDIYVQKTRESQSRSPHSYRPPYGAPENDDAAPTEGVLGQFVVQYDVEHSTDGEIFLNDGYFVHFFSPPQLKPLSKHIVFVLDTSGSMMDRKIVQLREAMTTILSELNAGDYFNIVEFASSTHVYELDEAKQEPKSPYANFYSYNERDVPIKMVPPSAATPDNIQLAKIIINRLTAAGGTNINEALSTAIQLVNRGVGWTGSALTTTSVTSTTPAAVSATPVATPATAIAEPKKDNVARPEPIIIFLTDGDPTVGEMDPKRIIKRISELNTGDKRAAIFSLAFGEDADRNFLRKLSLRNEGFLRHIYEAADAAQQLNSFYRQVSSPLLANVKFIYPADQVEEGSVTKHRFHTLYKGSEAVVAGRVANLGDDAFFTPRVEGFCGVQSDEQKEYASVARIPVKRDESSWGALERLWAYMSIKQKLDEKDSTADEPPKDKENTPEKEALRLALKYSFVTPLTSLVVVKPNATSAVDAESVDKKPSSSPYGVGGFAYHGLQAAGIAGPPGLPGSSFLARPSAHFGGGSPGAPGAAYPAALFAPALSLPQATLEPAAAADANNYALEDTMDYDSSLPESHIAPIGGSAYSFSTRNVQSSHRFTPASLIPASRDPYMLVDKILGGTSSSDLIAPDNADYAFATRMGTRIYPRYRPRPVKKSQRLSRPAAISRNQDNSKSHRAASSPSFMNRGPALDLMSISSFNYRPYSYNNMISSPHSSHSHSSSNYAGCPNGLCSLYIPGFPGPQNSVSFGQPGVGSIGYISTPATAPTHIPPTTVLTSPAPTTPTPRAALAAYGLQEFEWVLPLLNATAHLLTLDVEGKTLHLKLATDPTDLFASAGASCTSSINHQTGECTYLPHCAAAKSIPLDLYRTAYCDRDGYAGVCCPTQSTPAVSSAAAPEPKSTD